MPSPLGDVNEKESKRHLEARRYGRRRRGHAEPAIGPPDGVTGPVLFNPDAFVYPNDQQSTMLGTTITRWESPV